jgi:nucleoside-diphosphate-sugar epimerase
MRVFLTGATGLLGSHTAKFLLAKGCKIKASLRPGSHTYGLASWKEEVEWVEGSLLDPLFLHSTLNDCQAVVHCAGQVSFDRRDREALYTNNVLVTESVVNGALEANIEKFVYISSVAALGRLRHKSVVNEDAKWEDSDLNTYYAKTKHWAEQEVWRAEAEGLPIVVLNPSVIIGSHAQERSSSKLLSYLKDEPKFYPSGKLNWVGVENVTEAIYKALTTNDFNSNRYIISAGSVSYQEFFRVLADKVDKRAPYIEAKFYTMALAYYLKQIEGLFREKENLLTKETLKLIKTNIEFENSKSTNDLGIEYHSLDYTINSAIFGK